MMPPARSQNGQRPIPPDARTIMVSGCTGFIGSRLAARLSSLGYSVRGLTRQKIDSHDNITYVRADAFDLPGLTGAMEGVDVAYYMLHSMEGSKREWQDFAKREREQARTSSRPQRRQRQEDHLPWGLVSGDDSGLSPHMKSRKEVGQILASGSIPVTELRASIIIGAYGGSFTMLRYLVERLSVMVCPSWVGSYAQPIAVDDVVAYLVACLKKGETAGRIFEIGGPDKMTYEQLMRAYAAYLDRRLFVLRIPFLTTRLSSLWVDLVTPVKAALARPLIDSLVHDTVVTDVSITKIIPLDLKTVTESIDIAVKEAGSHSNTAPVRDGRTGFRINQKVIMLSLLALAACGTSYYWLDDRPVVYEPLWLSVSAAWYATIAFAIVMVRNKTRLGYVIAGVLSWVTLSFWLLDNFHVVCWRVSHLCRTQPGNDRTQFCGGSCCRHGRGCIPQPIPQDIWLPAQGNTDLRMRHARRAPGPSAGIGPHQKQESQSETGLGS